MLTDSRPIWDAPLAEILSQPATSGTRASATDIPGVNIEWMATGAYPTGAWFGDCGQPTLAQLNALPTAYLALGARASVLGVQYTYGDGGWVIDGITPYADYDTLSAETPTVGKIAQIPRLCGNGYFALRGNGTRWEVCPGESIIRDAGVDSAGYDLTATGTAYVPLVSYTVPAELIGDGEEWEFDSYAMSLNVHASGSDAVNVFLGGANLRGPAPGMSAIGQTLRKRAAFVRLGGLAPLVTTTSNTDLYASTTNGDTAIDFETALTLNAGFVPGAATNKMRLRHFCFRRIG